LWAAGALPFSLALVPRYALAAAWLLYEQSVGAALAWCAMVLGLINSQKHPERSSTSIRAAQSKDAAWPLDFQLDRILRLRPANKSGPSLRMLIRPALATIGVVMILLFSLWFVRTRMAYYERLSDALWSLADAIGSPAEDESALVINFPRLARPPDRVYAIGVESPQFYARLGDLRAVLAVNGIPPPDDIQSLTFGNLIPPLDYSIETMGHDADWPDLAAAIASADRVYRAFPDPDHIPIRYVGQQLLPSSAEPLVRFGQSVDLIDAEARFVDPRLLAVTLRWQYAGGADDASVFVHVLNEAGALVAQSDGPVMDMLPFWQWPGGQQVEEVRYIALSGDDAQRLHAGVYDPVTNERLAPVDANGQVYPDGAVPLFDVDASVGTLRLLINR
jgi:hypothetical protein